MDSSGHAVDELLPTAPFWAAQSSHASQAGHNCCSISAASINDDHLGPMGPAGQIGQQQGKPSRFVQRRDQDAQPCHRLRSRR